MSGWTIHYHPLVVDEDLLLLKKRNPVMLDRIMKSIETKLMVDPLAYGQPLGSNLAGYYKLRVGNHRIVYEVKKKAIVVYVMKIGIRKDEKVYKELLQRLSQISKETK